MAGYEIHQFAEIFPLHDGPRLWELRDDIKEHGQVEDIVLYQSKVLDGRRRQACLLELGVTPRYTQFKGSDESALAFVVSKNLKRRHLGEAERAMCAAAIAKLKHGGNREISRAPGGKSAPALLPTQAQAADMMNVSVDAVKRAKKVSEQGTESLKKAVKDEIVTLSDAANVASERPKVQDQAIAAVRNGKAPTATRAVKPKQGKPVLDCRPFDKWYGGLVRYLSDFNNHKPSPRYKTIRAATGTVLEEYKLWLKE